MALTAERFGTVHNQPPTQPLPAHLETSLGQSFERIIKGAQAPAGPPLRHGFGPADETNEQNAAAPLGPAEEQQQLLAQVAQVLGSVSSSTFSDGSIHSTCPGRTLLLVHAVKQPLAPPDFKGDAAGSDFRVKRKLSEPAATVETEFSAQWPSTAKITCIAEWTDCVDDLSQPAPATRTIKEVAFEFLNQNGTEKKNKFKPQFRAVQGIQHRFRDTRAHSVTYTLSAHTRFAEYYLSDKDTATIPGTRSCAVEVASSVRPPTPLIPYIIPAFAWQDVYTASSKTWQRGRTMVLRVYLERPFLISGDRESLGVVLTAASGKTSSASVTQWGADPILNNGSSLKSSYMTADHFVCDPSQIMRDCKAFEDGGAADRAVDVVHFPVEFSRARGLWFCDIPLSPSQMASAFARLALVRWQPSAITNGDDCRLSQVVTADFIQVRPDRWVSVKKNNSKEFNVCISGVFPNPPNQGLPRETISCAIEKRWHRLGEDLGWRPVCAGPAFTYTKGAGSMGQWNATVKLPNSAGTHRFRLLLEEHEWLKSDTDKSRRTTYLHYIEL